MNDFIIVRRIKDVFLEAFRIILIQIKFFKPVDALYYQCLMNQANMYKNIVMYVSHINKLGFFFLWDFENLFKALQISHQI